MTTRIAPECVLCGLQYASATGVVVACEECEDDDPDSCTFCGGRRTITFCSACAAGRVVVAIEGSWVYRVQKAPLRRIDSTAPDAPRTG